MSSMGLGCTKRQREWHGFSPSWAYWAGMVFPMPRVLPQGCGQCVGGHEYTISFMVVNEIPADAIPEIKHGGASSSARRSFSDKWRSSRSGWTPPVAWGFSQPGHNPTGMVLPMLRVPPRAAGSFASFCLQPPPFVKSEGRCKLRTQNKE